MPKGKGITSVGVRPKDYREMKRLADEWRLSFVEFVGALARGWRKLDQQAQMDAIRDAGKEQEAA